MSNTKVAIMIKYCVDSEWFKVSKLLSIIIDEFLHSMDHSLNVTMVNQLLRSDDVTVTLQWPREPGAVYRVSVFPETPHAELTSMEHNVFTMNLTISYNIQYNVSIVSSLCGVSTTKVLNFGKMPSELSD